MKFAQKLHKGLLALRLPLQFMSIFCLAASDPLKERRQQIKAYGILYIITVDAKAAKFNIIPTMQNLGSGLALLSIATIICDVFVLYVHKHKLMYRTHKYDEITTEYDMME